MNGIEGQAGKTPREVAAYLEMPTGEVDFLKLASEGTQLSVLSRNYGVTNTAKYLALLITDFAGDYNVAGAMNSNQIADLSEEFAVDYWDLKLEDFAVFFTRAKKNIYGKIFNRVDRGVIHEMFAVYLKERTAAFIDFQEHGHERIQGPIPEKLQSGPFTFGDLVEVIQGKKTMEDVIAEKNGVIGKPEKPIDTEAEARAAKILEIRIAAFVEEVMKFGDPRARYSQPFYKENSEAIEEALKIARREARDASPKK